MQGETCSQRYNLKGDLRHYGRKKHYGIRRVECKEPNNSRRINSHLDLYIVAKCYIGSSIFFLVL